MKKKCACVLTLKEMLEKHATTVMTAGSAYKALVRFFGDDHVTVEMLMSAKIGDLARSKGIGTKTLQLYMAVCADAAGKK